MTVIQSSHSDTAYRPPSPPAEFRNPSSGSGGGSGQSFDQMVPRPGVVGCTPEYSPTPRISNGETPASCGGLDSRSGADDCASLPSRNSAETCVPVRPQMEASCGVESGVEQEACGALEVPGREEDCGGLSGGTEAESCGILTSTPLHLMTEFYSFASEEPAPTTPILSKLDADLASIFFAGLQLQRPDLPEGASEA